MKTDPPSVASVASVEETAASDATDRWVPLVDEPPPLDWDLEDLLPPVADATATPTLHIGPKPVRREPAGRLRLAIRR